MFEIRITCHADDAPRAIDALSSTFTIQSAHRTTQDSGKTHIHINADHRTAPQEWPTPDQAYATAPSAISEIGWVARTAADRPFGTETSREFWLRKAALLDRIALDDKTPATTNATEAAIQAARQLMDVDNAAVICDPRYYARQQYARWITNQ
ncbi:hypothetical protein ACFWV1_15905 [Streptomyces sp. NPDC058700]|uniref:hypothetical protein n=1 Tax=Streptomyces sp. NPDC058700 TaxID=3346607 RepID=UPI003652FA06